MSKQETKPGLTYQEAGVDIAAQDRALELMRQDVRSTYTPQVVSDHGAFGGMLALEVGQYKEPLLVSSIDSVGTKLKVAFLMNKHDTVGEDIVAHCVNDILVQGAAPLFFLDYLGVGKLVPEVVAEVVSGLARACREAGCVLIGGEIAELPGFYQPGEYDLVGVVVGVVERSEVIDGRTIRPGDAVLGLASSGLHTNGYSLARKVLLEGSGWSVDDVIPELGTSLGEELLKPHRCYRRPVEHVRAAGPIKGLAHITGGGLVDNVPRILPEGTAVVVDSTTWPRPPIFDLIADRGRVARDEMFHTFNMGIGLVMIVADEVADAALARLAEVNTPAYRIGEVTVGERRVVIG